MTTTEAGREGRPPSYNVAVIGIGAMGGGMARAMLDSPVARQVSVHDRATTLVEAFYKEAQAVGKAPTSNATATTSSNSLQDAVDSSTNYCIIVLQNEAQCEETCFGGDTSGDNNNLLSLLPFGSCVLLTSTVTATWAKKASKAFAARGIALVDAPMSGGPVRARQGDLTIMASMDPPTTKDSKKEDNGYDDTIDNCPAKSVLEALGGQVYWIKGGAGMGSTVKMVHQLLAGVHIVAAAEALALAAKAGLDVAQMYDIVNGAAGASWMFKDRGTRMLQPSDTGDNNGSSSVEVKSQTQIFVKDLDIVHAEAKRLQAPIPVASAALQQFISATSLGLGRKDDSQVVQVYEKITGVEVITASGNKEAQPSSKQKREGSNVGDYWKLSDGSMEEILEVAMEPRHLLVLSNQYVRALRVEFPPNDTTLAHRHDQDSIYFFLVEGGASIVNHVQGNDPKCDCVDFGEVRYGTHKTDVPLIHKITNTCTDKNLLCIDAELLKQPPITAAIPLVAEHHELIKTRDKCRVYQLTLQPGESVTVSYPFFYLTIVVQPGSIEKKSGSSSRHGLGWKDEEAMIMGSVSWNEPTFDLTKTNVGETTYIEYIAEWR